MMYMNGGLQFLAADPYVVYPVKATTVVKTRYTVLRPEYYECTRCYESYVPSNIACSPHYTQNSTAPPIYPRGESDFLRYSCPPSQNWYAQPQPHNGSFIRAKMNQLYPQAQGKKIEINGPPIPTRNRHINLNSRPYRSTH